MYFAKKRVVRPALTAWIGKSLFAVSFVCGNMEVLNRGNDLFLLDEFVWLCACIK